MSVIKDYLDDLNAEQKEHILVVVASCIVVLVIISAITYYNVRDQEIVRECVKAGHSTRDCKRLVGP